MKNNYKLHIGKMSKLLESMSRIELECVMDMTKDCLSNIGSQLQVGDAVMVVQKTKKTPGVITAVNTKRAVVSMRGGSYRVPFAMLEAA